MSDAQLVCTKTIKSRIFDLTDAVSEGNISKALMLLNDMVSLKEPMQKIMFMIIRQIRMVYRIKLLKEQGLPDSAATKELGLTPYVATKVIRSSRNLSAQVLENAIYYSAKLDQAVKSGRMADRTAVELLIASLEKL
jgi:DNA polymerase-3 subunit delta